MNPLLNILGMPNPAEMAGGQAPGGQKGVFGANPEGQLFADFLMMGLGQEKPNGELPLDFGMLNPEGKPAEGEMLPKGLFPVMTAEFQQAEQTGMSDKTISGNPEMPKNPEQETALLKLQGVQIVQPGTEEGKPDGKVTLVEDELIPDKLLLKEQEVTKESVKSVLLNTGKDKAAIDPLSLDMKQVILKGEKAVEPQVMIEKGLEKVPVEQKAVEQKTLETFKEPLNIREIKVNSFVKPPQNENSGPVRGMIAEGPEEFSMKTSNFSQGKGQEFDLNRQDTPKMSFDEFSSKVNSDKSQGGFNFKSLFDSEAVKVKVESGQNMSAMKSEAEMTVTQSTQTVSGGKEFTKVEVQPVRFVVPSELNDGKMLNNRTVMIKMEPEQLGSVRMTLSSVHDGLNARLVVDSAAAKTAVESNLNQLMDQLARQGVKVDFFEVSVGGSQVGKESKENQAFEFNRQFGNNRNEGSAYQSELGGSGTVERGSHYIGAGGVNCFA